MTTRPSRLQRGLIKRVIVPLASASSTMLERALSTVLNLLNRLDDEHEEPVPEVFGCRNCGLIYDPQLYHHSNVAQREDRQWGFCPVCCARQVELLGPLPHTIENAKGFFLLDEEGESQGPFETATATHAALWDWFNRKSDHGNCEEKEGGGEETIRQEGKVIRLVTQNGVYQDGEKGDDQGEGDPKAEGKTEGEEGGGGSSDRSRKN